MFDVAINSLQGLNCSSIWGKCGEKLQMEVQKCINFAAKVASNAWEIFKTRPRHPTIKRLEMD